MSESQYRRAYDAMVQGMRTHMLGRAGRVDRPKMFLGELQGDVFNPRMEHLACFSGGMLALGATHGRTVAELRGRLSAGEQADLLLAEQLTETCWHMYASMPTGLSADAVHFRTNGIDRRSSTSDHLTILENDAANYLRPETVESLFVLWRITGKPQYRYD